MKSKKRSIGINAAILGAAGILVKILGAVYRIPITSMIQDEGIGYYQAAYPIYEIMLAITTAGLPVAVATMVSSALAEKRWKDSYRTFQVAFYLMATLGMILGVGTYFFSHSLVHFFKNPGAYYAVVALVPAMVLSPMLAAIRGYYQGLQIMTPTAISQIIIQFFRVLSGLYITYLLLPKGYEVAAGGASFGASFGAFVGLLYMVYVHLRHKKEMEKEWIHDKSRGEDSKSILKEMIRIALPISLGAAIIPIMDFIDIRLVMTGLLDAGFTEAAANLRFGWLKGMAQTLIGVPQVIAIAIGVSIIPVLSSLKVLHEVQKLKERTNTIIKITLLIALPCSVGLYVLSQPIVELLYFTTSPEAIAGTAKILKILSLEVVPLMFITVITSMLQAIGKERIPVYNLIGGAVVKIILTYILTRNPIFHVFGAAIASLVAYGITFALDVYACNRLIPIKILRQLPKPLINSLLMGGVVYYGHRLLLNILPVIGLDRGVTKLATIGAVVLGAIVYGGLIIVTKTISKEELKGIRRKDQ
ncbi:MAG: polysaccharide biosynthesis protein [Tissierellia bacterium]|nr:polysaccharide biosynthesis protein [Tissierellia bacterium]